MHKPLSARGGRGEKPARTSLNPMPPSLSSSILTDLSTKQPSAFYSCLAIPVEGAVPIQDASVAPPKVLLQAPMESRRAPRKSKTDALAAMQIQAQSTDEQHEMLYDENGVRTYTRSGPPIPVSPRFDLTTVKTISPRSLPPRTKPRPFGLQECPTFYPTMEEFKDPMGYIRSISDKAKDSGICKVVPPVGWKMPFVTDTEASVLLLAWFTSTYRTLEFSLQNPLTMPKLHRGVFACKTQLFGTAISLSQTTGQSSSFCTRNKP